MTQRLQRLVQHRPFLMALVLLSIPVVVGFWRIEQTVNRTDQVAAEAAAVAEANVEVATANRAVVTCVTRWVRAETDALLDRDAVTQTVRAAERKMWGELYRYLNTAKPGASRVPMLEAIEAYRTVERRLARTVELNPYPKIERCLTRKNATALGMSLAAYRALTCMGQLATVVGSHGNDVLHGTDRRDVFKALRGDDLVLGGRGPDLICGNRGDDTLNGGQDPTRRFIRNGCIASECDACSSHDHPH
jgi:hypothetical protein